MRFIYSWDDFDVFRKVPLGMPKPELLAKHLGHSIVDVPDPFDEHDSYASHHIAQFERGLPPVVVGLAVYLMLSNAGPLGVLQLLYTPTAMIIAQTVLVTPIGYEVLTLSDGSPATPDFVKGMAHAAA